MNFEVCGTGREYVTTTERQENKILDKQEQQQHHATKAEGIDSCHSVLDLPTHLLYDILLMLPTKAIFNCKCVCKTFLNISIDPYFIETHLTKPNYILLTQDMTRASNLCLDYNYTLGLQSPYQTSLSMPSVASRSKCELSLVIGESNGLLCLGYQTKENTLLYICNPILGEFMALPFHNPGRLFHYWFGFCPKTEQYKIVGFVNSSICKIHTIGSDSWRMIDSIPRPHDIHFSPIDYCLHGNLHWKTNTDNFSNLICSFNLQSEKIVYMSPPTHLNQDTPRDGSRNRIMGKFGDAVMYILGRLRVGVLGGSLCVCYRADDDRFEVYVMKEYGVKESWTKECSINFRFICSLQNRFFTNVYKFSSNGDLFIRCHPESIVCYNFRKGTFSDVRVDKKFELPFAFAFVPSFISLKTIAATSGDIEITQRKVVHQF